MFNGNEGEMISLVKAKEYTKNFRDAEKVATKRAVFIGKNIAQQVLNQENCFGLRLYFGRNDYQELNIIVVGVDSEGNDLYKEYIVEMLPPCPPYCAPNSQLL